MSDEPIYASPKALRALADVLIEHRVDPNTSISIRGYCPDSGNYKEGLRLLAGDTNLRIRVYEDGCVETKSELWTPWPAVNSQGGSDIV
jgi:hypothetical protein